MKSLYIFALCIFPSSLWATASRLVMDEAGQRIEFPACTVNGVIEWDQNVCTYYIGLGTGSVISVTPQNYELNLSTTLIINIDGRRGIGFESYSEWLSCQTKAGLKAKIKSIRTLIDSLSDFPLSDTRDYRERAGWLRSYYSSLP